MYVQKYAGAYRLGQKLMSYSKGMGKNCLKSHFLTFCEIRNGIAHKKLYSLWSQSTYINVCVCIHTNKHINMH